ncbi:MAG: hypothetical protein WC315_03870 [Candidatus Omnitrophota bacterium]
MALLWIDGFDNYGSTIDSGISPSGVLGRKYSITQNTNNFRIRAGRINGYSLDLNYDTSFIHKNSLTTVDTVVVGFAFSFASYSWPGYAFFTLYDGATVGINLKHTVNGAIQVCRGGTVLGTTADYIITPGIWKYLELKIKCHSSTGTYELRINGVNVLSGTGANTKAGTHDYHDGFRLTGIDDDLPKVDDFYFLDTSGATNNDFLGNIRVETIRPDANGDSTQFTPSSGNNYACVDETVVNDDTDYVEDSTSGHQDLYGYSATTLTTIKGLMICTDCRDTDVTDYNLKTSCKSGATDSDDAGQSVGSTSFVTLKRILETDPNTSSAWTQTDLNAAQFGVKVG